MKEIFSGIYKNGNEMFTVNLAPGTRTYGEKLVRKDTREFRNWEPTRSKFGAALMNGLKENPITKGSKILYLGASTGTTVSHVSDIIEQSGIIYAVEFADRVFQPLIETSRKRRNIVPIFADARKPEKIAWIEKVDVVYCDIAQPDETEITIRNAREFLKNGGYVMIAIKSQSIDVTKSPKDVYEQEKRKLEKEGFSVLQLVNLEPYEAKHGFILAKK